MMSTQANETHPTMKLNARRLCMRNWQGLKNFTLSCIFKNSFLLIKFPKPLPISHIQSLDSVFIVDVFRSLVSTLFESAYSFPRSFGVFLLLLLVCGFFLLNLFTVLLLLVGPRCCFSLVLSQRKFRREHMYETLASYLALLCDDDDG